VKRAGPRLGDAGQRALLLAPYVIGVGLLVLLPALFTFAVAFSEYDLLSDASVTGFDNFTELAGDPLFHRALLNSLIFAAVVVPLRLLGALSLALLLHRRFRGVGAARTAVYLPTVVPDVAYALLWLFLLNPLFGPVNAVLGLIGLPQPAWLASEGGAMAAIILMSGFTIGEGFVVALAARQELPQELYQLARVEGSSALHTFRRVTLPLLAPTLWLLAVRDTVFTLQISFVPAYILTDGGPDRATLFLPLLVFDNAFEWLRYGYAASMTLSMFILTALIVAVQFRLLRRWRFGLGR
jgi:multiple sugar transport system permease protein